MNASSKRLLAIVTIATIAAAVAGCAAGAKGRKSPPPLKTVAHVDLPRYMGDWRVIANIPYFAEKGCVDSIESYRLRKDGNIDNWFRYRKGTFDAPQKRIDATGAVVTNKTTNAEWKVSFVGGLVSAKYLVIDLDPNYQWTVVGHPSRNYGWIMAREKTMPEHTYQAILQRLRAQGYDTSRFVKVPQLPAQVPAEKKS